MNNLFATLLLFLVAGIANPCSALDLTPFPVRNLSPTALVHGLPVAESAKLLETGSKTLITQFDLANNSALNIKNNEATLLDGTTYIATLGLRYGLNETLQVGIDLPWVWHSEGFLDGFISDFHDFFNMNNGDRDKLEDDQLDYLYYKDGEERLRLQDETDGLGDLRLQLAWQFKETEKSSFTLQSQLKVPTGDADKLTGSEAWDIALALSTQRDLLYGDDQGAIWGGIGFTWLGSGEFIKEDVEDFAVSGWLGTGWRPIDWLALKLQIDGHTALYDSELAELGDPTAILTMGGTLGLNERTSLDISIGEDLTVYTSPDVTFHLRLTHNF